MMAQAEEVQALSTLVTAAAAEPIKAHVTNGMEEMRKVQTERLGLPVKSSEPPALARILEGSLASKETRNERPCDDPYFHFRSWIHGIGVRRRGRAQDSGCL